MERKKCQVVFFFLRASKYLIHSYKRFKQYYALKAKPKIPLSSAPCVPTQCLPPNHCQIYFVSFQAPCKDYFLAAVMIEKEGINASVGISW